MTLKNKAKVSFVAMAAAASFLNAAPVMAAPTDTTTKENIKIQDLNTTGLEISADMTKGLEINTITGNTSTVTVKTGLQEKDGKKVYLDEFGQEVTGLVEDGDKEYYFSENGMETGFVKEDGKTFYFSKEDGTRETGTIEDEGKTYIVHEDGSLEKGWVEKDDSWYYFNEDGSRAENETLNIEGVDYDFAENGSWIEPVAVEEPQEYQAFAAESSRYQAIANAAIAQIGVAQDCTMLVTNSLRAVGIYHHGAPMSYLSLGPTTANPVPGDIIVYTTHVAIYIGNGRAIHGGWNGYTTAEAGVDCSAAFVAFVHPTLP